MLHAEAPKISYLLLLFGLPYYFPSPLLAPGVRAMAVNFLLRFFKRNASIYGFLPSDTTLLLMSLQVTTGE